MLIAKISPIKIVMLGHRTSILTQLCFSEHYETTKHHINTEFFRKSIIYNEEKIRLQIWDITKTNNDKLFISATYFANCFGILLVYDKNNYSTFINIIKLYKYIKHLPSYNKNSTIYIIGYSSENNLNNNREVSEIEGKNLAKKYKAFFIELFNVLPNDHTAFYSKIMQIFKMIVIDIYGKFDNNLLKYNDYIILNDVIEEKNLRLCCDRWC